MTRRQLLLSLIGILAVPFAPCRKPTGKWITFETESSEKSVRVWFVNDPGSRSGCRSPCIVKLTNGEWLCYYQEPHNIGFATMMEYSAANRWFNAAMARDLDYA